MKTTLDRFGRVVVPKDIRDRLGLRPGAEIEIDEKGNEVVLKPVEQEPALMVREGILVYSGTATGDLRGAVRAHRDERLKKASGKKP
ncbi:MAG TPA: AbrB/MazE/SpoVT family DNA-binding domain-containing protein [Nitrospirota bacterium]|nr:AbrB/MazE/SpoVT family DNA-binding domain-containing protein [Nitrospirota bacterium]